MREAKIIRTTKETDVALALRIDGTGNSEIATGCAFLDHMLTLFARHGKFDLTVTCKGDTDVDYHHTTEDVGICLGQAFKQALGDKKGIVRYGDTVLPMDEALVLSAVDVSGRAYYASQMDVKSPKVGDFDTELLDEFFQAFASNLGVTLHLRQLAGSNAHHILEAAFKSVARSMRAAVAIDEKFADAVPSTKGVL